MGWISSRSDMIEDDESNFFYSDFKVILEMAENTHWIWDAATVFHGTTLGRLCAERPKSWKTCAKDNALRGQWSRANVVPHTQVTTARRMKSWDSLYIHTIMY
ncbi:hypothetical protein OF83DRAFT_1085004 [Amylostereum chailletii]|nr:hypothetical protein OF83DRAFT_1085004 [Amylostereum chailletii]